MAKLGAGTNGRSPSPRQVTPWMLLRVLAAFSPQSSHYLSLWFNFTLRDSIIHRLQSFLLQRSVAFRWNTIYFKSIKNDCARIHTSPKHGENCQRNISGLFFVKIFISYRLETLFLMSMLLFFQLDFSRVHINIYRNWHILMPPQF